MVEFALILSVLLFFVFIIIESGRMFQGWLTVQNSARSAGRYALTGDYETECLYDFPACLDPRVASIKDESKRSAAGLSINPNVLVGESGSFSTEVWSKDDDENWIPDNAGKSGDPVRVKVTYKMPLVVPLFSVIVDSISLRGQVTVTNEEFDQVATSRTYTSPPDFGQGPEENLPNADLTILKSATPLTVYTEHALEYSITVQNNGPYDAEDVVVVDTLPAGTTYLNSIIPGGGFCDPQVGDTLTCYLPDLSGDGGPEGSATLVINVTSPTEAPTDPTPITNIASVSNGPATIDPNMGNNNASVIVNLVPWADLSITKSDNPDPVRISKLFTYILRVTNNGPNDSYDVVVVDELPDEVTYVDSGPGSMCSYDSGVHTVRCVSPLLEHDSSIDFTIDVIAPPHVDFVDNDAAVTSLTDDLDLSNNNSSETTTVTPALTDLWIEKYGLPYDPYAGEQITYIIDVHNSGPDYAPEVFMEDVVPSGLIIDSFGATQGACGQAGNVITCTLGALDVNGSAQVTIVATTTLAVINNNQDTLVLNQAEVFWGVPDQSDPTPGNNVVTYQNLVREWVDLSLTKYATEQVYDGDLITYTFEIYNDGPFLAENVVLYDDFPPRPDNWPIGDVDGLWSDPVCQRVNAVDANCLLGDIDIGATAYLTIVARADWPGLAENWATVSADEDDPYDQLNNIDTAFTLILPKTGLEVNKTAPATGYNGVPFEYTLLMHNNGPSDAFDVVLTDTLPITASFTSVNPSTICDYDVLDHIVTCQTDLPIRSPNQLISIWVTPTVEGEFVNRAAISSDDFDPFLLDNTDVVTTVVRPAADLLITKTGPTYVEDIRDRIDYVIEVTNNGPSIATNVTIVDIFPLEIDLIGNPPPGYCDIANNEITCTLSDPLLPGESFSFGLKGKSKDTGYQTNVVTVSATEHDPDLGDNMVSSTAFVNADTDLVMDKQGPDFTYTGELLPYSLVVYNDGDYTAHGVQIIDTLPLTVTFDSADQGCVYNDRPLHTVTCDIPSIASKTTATVTVNVIPDEKGLISNTAVVDGMETDPNTANNTDTLETFIDPAADLAMDKTAPENVAVNETFAYTLMVFNGGPYTATEVFISDRLPDSVTFVSASTGCEPGSDPGSPVVCFVPEIAPYESAIINIWVTADEYGTVENIADAFAFEMDLDFSNNSDSATTNFTLAELRLSKTASNPAYVGEDLLYTLEIFNDGPSTATSVVVTDTLPDGVVFGSADAGCSHDDVTHIVTCDLDNIPSQVTTTVQITVVPSQTGTIENAATVLAYEYDSNLTDNTDSATSNVEASADLSLLKSGPQSVTVGEQFEYTLVVSNNGPSDGTGVTVIDTIPSEVTYMGDSLGCSFALPTLTCDVGDLAAGSGVTITIQVEAATFGVADNTAAVSAIEFDPAPENNSSGVSTEITQADLSVEKSGPITVTVNETFDYSLDVSNNGPGAATGVVVTDTLPATFVFVSANQNCTELSGNRIVCDLSQMNAGESTNILLTVYPTAFGSYENLVEVYGDPQDPELANNTDSWTTDVTEVNLQITKTASTPVYVGQEFVYTIEVYNDGPSTATSVTIADALPAEVIYVSDTGGCSYDNGQHLVTCSLAPLAPLGSTTFDIVIEPIQSGTIDNTVTVEAYDYDPDLSNNTSSATSTATTAADLQIVKSGPNTATVTDPVVYDLSVTNLGPSNATGVVVVDTLPAGIDFVSADPLCGYDGGTREVTCSIGNLAFGTVQNLTINAVASQPGDNENIATISGDDLDLDLGNNTSSVTTHVTQADLEIVKSAPPVSTIGASLVYTLDVTNHGPSASTNTIVIDTLPANVILDSASAGCFYDGDVTVTCALGAVNPATTISINITVIPTIDASQTALENTASVAGDAHDSDISNNTDSVTTTITEANLNLGKSGTDSVTVGDQIEYLLTIRNKGPSVATGVILTDTLPASVSFVSASPGCVESGGVVVCDIGAIAVDTNADATILVVANQPGQTVNVAETWSSAYDSDPDSNSAIFTTTVTSADLGVVKTAPASATVNGPFDYNISVSNSGPSTANNVVLVDTLPPSVVYNSGNPSCTESGNVVTCNLGAIAVGGSVDVTINVTPGAQGSVNNSTTASADDFDPELSNNSDTASTYISSADLAITKSAPANVFDGENFVYAMEVENNGPSTASNVRVVDTLPAFVTYVSDDAGCTAVGNVVTCALGTINPLEIIPINITVTTEEPGILLNTAEVTGDDYDPAPLNNTDAATTTVDASADLSLAISAPVTFTVNAQFAYTLTVTNNGPSNATGVVVLDTLPADVSYISDDSGCTIVGQVVSCTLGTVLTSIPETVVINVMATTQGTVIHTATVSANENDPDPGNNSDSANTTI